MNEDARITLRKKGYLKQQDGSYSKVDPLASTVQKSILELPVRDESLGQSEGTKDRCPSVRISITRYSRRPIDDCNLSTKALVDCIRYAGIILDDNWSNLEVVGEQKKVAKEEHEGTEIVIEYTK